MELNFKDEDKLIEFLKSINYNFSIQIRKDASGIRIVDFDKDAESKLSDYERIKEELEEAEDRISDLEDEIYELENED